MPQEGQSWAIVVFPFSGHVRVEEWQFSLRRHAIRYAAAVVGGFITLQMALQIVATRAQSTETLAAVGAMLSVADWPSEELEALAQERGQRGLWLAAVNSPQHAVVSGSVEAVEELEQQLRAQGKKASRLHVKRAFHSGLIAKAAESLRNLATAEELQGVEFIPVVGSSKSF